jgi:hypothetical protein
MTYLKPALDCKPICRGAFGFFRKPKGSADYIDAAKQTLRTLNQLVLDKKDTPTNLERLENELYFHTMTAMYTEGRKDLTKHIAALLDILSHGIADYLTPERRYKFLLFLFPLTLFTKVPWGFYWSGVKEPTDLWASRDVTYSIVSWIHKHRELITQSNKSFVDVLTDLAQVIRAPHISCYTMFDKADVIVQNLSPVTLEYAAKKKIVTATLLALTSPARSEHSLLVVDDTMMDLFSGFLRDLALDRMDVGISVLSHMMAEQWEKNGDKSHKGFAYFKDRTLDPFETMPLDLPTFTKEESRLLRQALSHAKMKDLLFTFLVRKELNTPDSNEMLKRSLLDFNVFGYELSKGLSATRDHSYMRSVFFNYSKNVIKERLTAAIANMGPETEINREAVLNKLTVPVLGEDFLAIFKPSVVTPTLFSAARFYFTANTKPYVDSIRNNKECMKLLGPIFDVDVGSELTWIDSACSSSLVFKPIQLKFDMSETDIAAIKERLANRTDTNNVNITEFLYNYANLSILKTILREANAHKVEQLKFKPKDLSF